jgi:hypothetical protein
MLHDLHDPRTASSLWHLVFGQKQKPKEMLRVVLIRDEVLVNGTKISIPDGERIIVVFSFQTQIHIEIGT